jgi:hypothetical protein
MNSEMNSWGQNLISHHANNDNLTNMERKLTKQADTVLCSLIEESKHCKPHLFSPLYPHSHDL